MAKRMSDGGADAALNYWTDADVYALCSAEPTSYTEGNSTYKLGGTTPTFDAIANGDVSGRKRGVQAKSGISIAPASAVHSHIATSPALSAFASISIDSAYHDHGASSPSIRITMPPSTARTIIDAHGSRIIIGGPSERIIGEGASDRTILTAAGSRTIKSVVSGR